MSNNIAIILSGGIGTRLGQDTPKQYLLVNDRPIIGYCLETFAANPIIHALIIVADSCWQTYVLEQLRTLSALQDIFFAVPGETRQYSILNALQVAEEHFQSEDIVIIHDAARPLVSKHLIDSCIEGVSDGYDGVLPVLPVKDTVYQSYDQTDISNLLPRDTLFAGQAPESFVLGKYLWSHRNISREELLKINGSTELAYKQGLKIRLIPGEESNFKITTKEDLDRFKLLISQNK